MIEGDKEKTRRRNSSVFGRRGCGLARNYFAPIQGPKTTLQHEETKAFLVLSIYLQVQSKEGSVVPETCGSILAQLTCITFGERKIEH